MGMNVDRWKGRKKNQRTIKQIYFVRNNIKEKGGVAEDTDIICDNMNKQSMAAQVTNY